MASKDPVARLVAELARLPGIGEKSATRLAFHLIRRPPSQVRELAEALIYAVENIRLCDICQNFTDVSPCARCGDARRDAKQICVVAQPSDVSVITRWGEYRGAFHVLHGQLSPLDGIGPSDLRITELLRRIESKEQQGEAIEEVIVATSASVEGEATAMYIARLLAPFALKVSRIATGLPVGGEIEYADTATIARAFSGRAALHG